MKIYVLCFQAHNVNRLLWHTTVIKGTYISSNSKYKFFKNVLDSCDYFISIKSAVISQNLSIAKRFVWGYVNHTHLFFIPAKFPKLIFSYPKYFCVSETSISLE
jgi:hypothetical protein